MSVTATIQEVESDLSYGLGILQAILPKQPGTTGGAGGGTTAASAKPSAPAASLTLGVDPLPELTAGFGTVTAISKLITQRDAELNTPAEQQAATAQKLQDLGDHAAAVIAAAEKAGPGTPEWKALQLLLS